MSTFILGYLPDSVVHPDNLVEFESKDKAGFESEEWVVVTADNLESAKEKYEATFLKWQQRQALLTHFCELPKGIQILVNSDEVTYRGTADMKNEPEDCKLISVGEKEYVISNTDFEKLGGITKMRFKAPYRQHN